MIFFPDEFPDEPKVKGVATANAAPSDPYLRYAQEYGQYVDAWKGWKPEEILENAREAYTDESRKSSMFEALRNSVPRYRDKTPEEMFSDKELQGFFGGGLQKEALKSGNANASLPVKPVQPVSLKPIRPVHDLTPQRGLLPSVKADRQEQKDSVRQEHTEHEFKMQTAIEARMGAVADTLEGQLDVMTAAQMMRRQSMVQPFAAPLSGEMTNPLTPEVPEATATQPVTGQYGLQNPLVAPMGPAGDLLPQQITQSIEKAPPVTRELTMGERLKSAGGSYMQNLTKVVAGIPEAVAITAKQLDDWSRHSMSGKEEFWEGEYKGKEAPDLITYKLGQWIRKKGKEYFPTDPRAEREFLAGTLAAGAGSMTGFLAGGAIGKGSKVLSTLASGLLGAANMGAEEYQNALEKTGDHDKAWQAFIENAGWGATEAIPIGRVLNRLDKATKGGFRDAMTAFLIGGRQGALEEGIQEAIQQMGSNWSAQRIYDAQRSLTDGTLEGALAGAILGGLLGGGTAAFGAEKASGDMQWDQDEYRRQMQKKMNAEQEVHWEFFDPATGQRATSEQVKRAREEQKKRNSQLSNEEMEARRGTVGMSSRRPEGSAPSIVGSNLPALDLETGQPEAPSSPEAVETKARSAAEQRAYMNTQMQILQEAGIPEEEIPDYVQDSVADGAILGEHATAVIEGNKSVEEAAELVRMDYEKMKSGLKPAENLQEDISQESVPATVSASQATDNAAAAEDTGTGTGTQTAGRKLPTEMTKEEWEKSDWAGSWHVGLQVYESPYYATEKEALEWRDAHGGEGSLNQFNDTRTGETKYWIRTAQKNPHGRAVYLAQNQQTETQTVSPGEKRVAGTGSIVEGQEIGEPTEAQKEAGNYTKGHTRLHGLDVSVENEKGSVRTGKDENGKPWSVELKSDYGYFLGTEGKDKDHIDVFVGPETDADFVAVINQKKPDGSFDEHKVVMGVSGREAALDEYLANYAPDWVEKQGGALDVAVMSVDAFKDWLKRGNTKRPFPNAISVKPGQTAEAAPETAPEVEQAVERPETLEAAPMAAPMAAPAVEQTTGETKPIEGVEVEGITADSKAGIKPDKELWEMSLIEYAQAKSPDLAHLITTEKNARSFKERYEKDVAQWKEEKTVSPRLDKVSRTPFSSDLGITKQQHATAITQALRSGRLDPVDAERIHIDEHPNITQWQEFKEARKPLNSLKLSGRSVDVYRTMDGYEATDKQGEVVRRWTPKEYEKEISKREKLSRKGRERIEDLIIIDPEDLKTLPALKAMFGKGVGDRTGNSFEGVRVGKNFAQSKSLVDTKGKQNWDQHREWLMESDDPVHQSWLAQGKDFDDIFDLALEELANYEPGKTKPKETVEDPLADVRSYLDSLDPGQFIAAWQTLGTEEKQAYMGPDYEEIEIENLSDYKEVYFNGEWHKIEHYPEKGEVRLKNGVTLTFKENDPSVVPVLGTSKTEVPEVRAREEAAVPFSKAPDIPTDPNDLAKGLAARLRGLGASPNKSVSGKRSRKAGTPPSFQMFDPQQTARIIPTQLSASEPQDDLFESAATPRRRRVRYTEKPDVQRSAESPASDVGASATVQNQQTLGLESARLAGLGVRPGPVALPQSASLLGTTVNTPEDLAVLAQRFRDNKYETFRFFYMKGNDVVGTDAVTSRLPNAAIVDDGFVLRARQRYEALGADGYYLVHNHPSRITQASSEDLQLTSRITFFMSDMGSEIDALAREVLEINGDMIPGTDPDKMARLYFLDGEAKRLSRIKKWLPHLTSNFRGHVVIDHNKYVNITSTRGVFENAAPMPTPGMFGEVRELPISAQTGKDALRPGPIPHPALWKGIRDVRSAASVAWQLTHDGKSYAALVHINNAGDVVAIEEVPLSWLRGEYQPLSDHIASRQESIGATRTIVSLDNAGLGNDENQRGVLREPGIGRGSQLGRNLVQLAEKDGLVVDVITTSNGSTEYASMAESGTFNYSGGASWIEKKLEANTAIPVREKPPTESMFEDEPVNRKRSSLEEYGTKNPDQIREMEKRQRQEKARQKRTEKEEKLRKAKETLSQYEREQEFNFFGLDPQAEAKLNEARREVAVLRTELDEGMFEAEGQAMLFSKAPKPFYSQLRKVAEDKLPGKGSGIQYAQMFEAWGRKGEFKAEEIEWSGLIEWLQSQGKITKQDVLDFLDQNEVKIEEVVYSEDAPDPESSTKYQSYVTPGGENYRELLLTLPNASEDAFSRRVIPGQSELYDKYAARSNELSRIILSNNTTTDERADAINERDGVEAKMNALTETLGRQRAQHPYSSSRWKEPNVLAHIRFNDRTGPNGERILFVEEIQSDWHQEGRESGYRQVSPETKKRYDEAEKRLNEYGGFRGAVVLARETKEAFAERTGGDAEEYNGGKFGFTESFMESPEGKKYADIMEALNESTIAGEAYRTERQSGVPDAPFKKTWHELVFKRVLRWAVENGYDAISWTPGDIQAERYDLSKKVKAISYSPEAERLRFRGSDGPWRSVDEAVPEDKLSDYVGKEVAQKIFARKAERKPMDYKVVARDNGYYLVDENGHPRGRGGEPTRYRTRSAAENGIAYIQADQTVGAPIILEGVDLKIGGEGMQGFYDKMIPSFVSKYVKKWGGQVGKTKVLTGESSMRAGEMTQEERAAFMRGDLPYDRAVEAWNLPITEQMRESVMMGQPLFSKSRKQAVAEEGRILDLVTQGTPEEFRKRILEIQGIKGEASYDPTRDNVLAEKGRPLGTTLHELGHRMFIRYAPDDLHSSIIMAAKRMEDVLGRTSMEKILERLGGKRRYDSEAERQRYEHPAKWIRENYGKSEYGYELEAEIFRLVGEAKANAHKVALSIADRLKKVFPEDFAQWTAKQIADIIFGAYKVAQNIKAKFGNEGAEYRSAVADFLTGNEWTKHDPDRVARLRKMDPNTKAWFVQLGIDVWKGSSEFGEWVREMKTRLSEQDAREIAAPYLPMIYRGVKEAMTGEEQNLFDVPFVMDPETKRNRFRRYMQDRFNRVLNLQESIEKAGGVVEDKTDTYIMEELHYGKIKHRLSKVEDIIVLLGKAIAEAKKKGVTELDIFNYLYAKHAKERNAYVARINPELPDGGSGWTNEDADRELERLKDKEDVLLPIADMVYAINKEARNILRKDLETEERVQTWEEMFEYYVPLRDGDDPDKPVSFGGSKAKGFSIRGREKSITGRRSEAENLIEHSINNLMRAIVADEKNEVGKSLLYMARQNPNPIFWKIDKYATMQVVGKDGMVKTVFDSKYKDDPNVIVARVKGEDHVIEVADAVLARQLKRMYQGAGDDVSGLYVKVFGKLTRWVAAVNTAYTPEFVLTNFTRDIQAALGNVIAEKDAELAKAMTKDAVKMIPELWSHLLRGKQNKTSEWYDRFKAAGGKVGYYSLENISDIQKRMERQVRRITRPGDRPFAAVADMAKSSLDVISNVNEAVENATRLAVFKNLVERGISDQEAASYAKNLTVNFNRKGELGQALNSTYAFFNAALQGTFRLGKMLGTKRGKQIALGLSAMGFINNILNRMIAGDDDDEVNWYDKIPEYKKDTNWILMTGNENEHLSLPLPYGLNFFYAMGQYSADLFMGADPLHTMKRAFETSMTTFNPLGSGPIDQVFMPTFFEPIQQIVTNRNFFGGPIRPDQPPYQAPSPQSELYFQSVNPILKNMAQWMNEQSGGSKYRPGRVEELPWVGEFISNPENMEHMVEFVFGGTGKFVNNAFQTGKSVISGEKIESRKIPFARRFYGQPEDYVTEQSYRSALDSYEQYTDELEAHVKEGGDVEEWYKRNPWYSEFTGKFSSPDPTKIPKDGVQPMLTVKNYIKDIREFGKAIRALKDQDPERAEEMQKDKMKLIKRFMKEYNASHEVNTD